MVSIRKHSRATIVLKGRRRGRERERRRKVEDRLRLNTACERIIAGKGLKQASKGPPLQKKESRWHHFCDARVGYCCAMHKQEHVPIALLGGARRILASTRRSLRPV